MDRTAYMGFKKTKITYMVATIGSILGRTEPLIWALKKLK